ncbi:MAG: hypothetical protein QNL04_00290 [SAR324 cluster bacterium]|nr:hypothetical protein [SAR324 cluster bacterium]
MNIGKVLTLGMIGNNFVKDNKTLYNKVLKGILDGEVEEFYFSGIKETLIQLNLSKRKMREFVAKRDLIAIKFPEFDIDPSVDAYFAGVSTKEFMDARLEVEIKNGYDSSLRFGFTDDQDEFLKGHLDQKIYEKIIIEDSFKNLTVDQLKTQYQNLDSTKVDKKLTNFQQFVINDFRHNYTNYDVLLKEFSLEKNSIEYADLKFTILKSFMLLRSDLASDFLDEFNLQMKKIIDRVNKEQNSNTIMELRELKKNQEN